MLSQRWLDLLGELAEIDRSDLPFLSVYLDVRPDGAARRDCITWLRDRIHKHGKTVAYHGEALVGYEGDIDRITDYLGDFRGGRYDPASHGLVIFAGGARELWRVIELPVPVENRFHVGEAPLLAPLAATVAGYPDYVVALIDVDTCRVLAVSLAVVTERAELQGDTADLSWTARGGGWSHKRYQRHVDHWRSQFAKEAADLVGEVTQHVEAPYLVLAGEEWAVAELRRHLPRVAQSAVIAHEHLDVDWSNEAKVVAATEPLVKAEAARRAQAAADRVLESVAERRPAAVGIGPVLRALEERAVATIVLPPDLATPAWRCDGCGHIEEGRAPDRCPLCGGPVGSVDLAEVILRAALGQDAQPQYVGRHEELAAYGGVGALLRFALSAP